MKAKYYALYNEEDDVPTKIRDFMVSIKDINPYKDDLENVNPEYVIVTVESYSTTAQLKSLLKRPDFRTSWKDSVKYFIEKNVKISKAISAIFGK